MNGLCVNLLLNLDVLAADCITHGHEHLHSLLKTCDAVPVCEACEPTVINTAITWSALGGGAHTPTLPNKQLMQNRQVVRNAIPATLQNEGGLLAHIIADTRHCGVIATRQCTKCLRAYCPCVLKGHREGDSGKPCHDCWLATILIMTKDVIEVAMVGPSMSV